MSDDVARLSKKACMFGATANNILLWVPISVSSIRMWYSIAAIVIADYPTMSDPVVHVA